MPSSTLGTTVDTWLVEMNIALLLLNTTHRKFATNGARSSVRRLRTTSTRALCAGDPDSSQGASRSASSGSAPWWQAFRPLSVAWMFTTWLMIMDQSFCNGRPRVEILTLGWLEVDIACLDLGIVDEVFNTHGWRVQKGVNCYNSIT